MIRGICVVLVLSCLGGCTRAREIAFCEGVTPSGKGVKCGRKFTTGELSALVTSREPFGVRSISLRVLRVDESRETAVESLTIAVLPEQESAFANVSFYQEGRFRVKAVKNDTEIGAGEVEIVEE